MGSCADEGGREGFFLDKILVMTREKRDCLKL